MCGARTGTLLYRAMAHRYAPRAQRVVRSFTDRPSFEP